MKRKSKTAEKHRRLKPAALSEKATSVSSPPDTRAGTLPDSRVPSSYPRRILLAVTGLSPQVVTETLYALARTVAPPFVPTEIFLVTTFEGAERARLTLLSDDPGWFHRLRRDYELPEIAFDSKHIHVMPDAAGAPTADIRSLQDNEAAADFLTELVRTLTADDDAALHVSIAGGRKTMGFYAGYALSLFGRPQDRLSHVLVSTPFESNQEFYYPTPYSRVIYTHPPENRPLDARDAVVTLADIPFVRMREELPERLIHGQVSFSAAVGAAATAREAPRLILDVPKREARADGELLPLWPTEFAVLLWLAQQAGADDAEGVDIGEAAAVEEFLAVAARVKNQMGGDYERLERVLKRVQDSPKELRSYFWPYISKINEAFAQRLGKKAAFRYQIKRTGPRGRSRYFLPLEPEQIEIGD